MKWIKDFLGITALLKTVERLKIDIIQHKTKQKSLDYIVKQQRIEIRYLTDSIRRNDNSNYLPT